MPAQRLIGAYDTTVLSMLELSVELERFWFWEPARTFVLIFIGVSLNGVLSGYWWPGPSSLPWRASASRLPARMLVLTFMSISWVGCPLALCYRADTMSASMEESYRSPAAGKPSDLRDLRALKGAKCETERLGRAGTLV